MPGTIYSYDFHTYWSPYHPELKAISDKLREQVAAEFAPELEAGLLRLHTHWQKPVGPHPITMWELDTGGKYEPALFARVLAFYQLNHNGLLVLIHPRTDAGDYKDHTEHALWLGHKVHLMLDEMKASA